MKLNNKHAIQQFIKRFPQSRSPLTRWINTVEAATWNNAGDVSQSFTKTDCVNEKWLFNVGGNNYRLAAVIWFQAKTVQVLKVMTHEEYDEEKW